MKTFLLAVMLALSISSIAQADNWYWIQQGDGTFLKSNGVTNDGYVYQRIAVSSCYGGCYAQSYTYQQIGSYGHPQYGLNPNSDHFEDDLVKALAQERKLKLRMAALKEAGFIDDQYSRSYNNGGTTTTGLQVVQQGFAQLGNSVFGYASGQSGQYQANPTELIHLQDRSVERVGELAERVNNHLATNIGNLNQSTLEMLKARDTLSAILTASQKTTTTVVQQKPDTPQAEQYPQPPQGQPKPSDGSALSIVRGTAIVNNVCTGCHNGKNEKTKLDFTHWADISEGDRRTYVEDARKRLLAKPGDPGIMPPASKGTLAWQQQVDVIAALSQP